MIKDAIANSARSRQVSANEPRQHRVPSPLRRRPGVVDVNVLLSFTTWVGKPATGFWVTCRRWRPFAQVDGRCKMRPNGIPKPWRVYRYLSSCGCCRPGLTSALPMSSISGLLLNCLVIRDMACVSESAKASSLHASECDLISGR